MASRWICIGWMGVLPQNASLSWIPMLILIMRWVTGQMNLILKVGPYLLAPKEKCLVVGVEIIRDCYPSRFKTQCKLQKNILECMAEWMVTGGSG